ncbi:hypothetical protein CW731_14365 [Polaribacter sp. ALD11]|uniref:RNA polymerase sigma factor n=1 Tax=Polaribacter sp. ALD11 TaxID=2058137 RepID=UPI000C31AABB|nr:sigma-70 family RNA polymerase sigma factor [Polaribacter sp. ALD11]AUC86390.1 hypothetical protein CW731_14365 [Polaribacter sp. ALD11]
MNNNLLIAQIKKKDKVAFKNCYNFFFKDLVLHANKYLADFSISEDIVQEVFVYIWEYSGKIEIKTSLKAYLYAMVKNRSLNHLKTIKITDNDNYIDLSSLLVNNIEMFEASEENKDILYVKVLEVVNKMPLKMQEIFRLKFLENYKYNEISEELNVSVNTVKTQLKRAKVRIKDSVIIMLFLLLIVNVFI